MHSSHTDNYQYDDDYYNDDPFEEPSEDDDFFDDNDHQFAIKNEQPTYGPPSLRTRSGSPHPSRSSSSHSRFLSPKNNPRLVSPRSDSYASSNVPRDVDSLHSGDSGHVNDDITAEKPKNDSFIVGPPQSEIYGLQHEPDHRRQVKEIDSEDEDEDDEEVRSKAPSPEEPPEKPSWRSKDDSDHEGRPNHGNLF